MAVSSKRAASVAPTRKTKRTAPPPADVYAPDCPSRVVLDHVTSRWGVLVLVVLLGDTYRFSELRRRVTGVSEKMLAQTLQALEKDGFVLREVYPVIPPRVDYSLTPMGREAAKHVHTLVTWVEASLPRVMDAREKHERTQSRSR